MSPETDDAAVPDKPVASRELVEEQQAGILEIVLKGGSLVVAAQQLEVPVLQVFEWLDHDLEFARRYRLALRALDSNVLAKLYQEAMSGTSSAISLWIKERQPDDWKQASQAQLTREDWENCSDEQLVELALQLGRPESASHAQPRTDPSPVPKLSGVLSQPASNQ